MDGEKVGGLEEMEMEADEEIGKEGETGLMMWWYRYHFYYYKIHGNRRLGYARYPSVI
jgi:hypothetical protein